MAPTPWSAEQVLALAPDAASASAGRKLAATGSWSGTGVASEPAAVWGLCAGSGKNPYQTIVDLSGPAFRCSCPSRKFPCKHALGLLLLWSSGRIAAGEAPEWTSTWLTGRAQRAAAAADRAASGQAAERPAPDLAAAAKRAAERADRVAAGLAELDTWLADQVRGGLAGLESSGYGHFDTVAARMVDAQAPGVAARLRGLRGVVASGDRWPSRMLEELAGLRLTVAGHGRLAELPDGLAACVRREVGYPVSKDDVLAGPAVRDRWDVVGVRDIEEERLSTRRVWLRGQSGGRVALVLSFAASGHSLDASLVPGTTVDADLHFYPGTSPLRALVGRRHDEPVPLTALTGGTLADAHASFAAAVAADPWTTAWPVVIDALVPVPAEPHWVGVDAAGDRVVLTPSVSDLWKLLAVSGGRGVPLVGELTAAGVKPLSTLTDSRLVLL